jgi:hypothetical protein
MDILGAARLHSGCHADAQRHCRIHWRRGRGIPLRLGPDMGARVCHEGSIHQRYITLTLCTGWKYTHCNIGFALEKTQEKSTAESSEALNIYRSMIPYLCSLPISLGSYSPEFRVWTERMLSRMVALSMKFGPLGEWVDFESMLQMFHLWMSLFRFTPSNPKLPIAYEPPQKSPPLVELGLEVDYSRWDVWMSYYDTLSEILRRGYVYSPAYTERTPDVLQSRDGLSDEEFITVRLQQRAEIKKVENAIEAKLLDETRFPKSNERNSRVERWVDAVMMNWRVMCGPTWQDEELGAGGKNAIARGVLDVSVELFRCSISITLTIFRFFIEPRPRASIQHKFCATSSACTHTWLSSTLPSKRLTRMLR